MPSLLTQYGLLPHLTMKSYSLGPPSPPTHTNKHWQWDSVVLLVKDWPQHFKKKSFISKKKTNNSFTHFNNYFSGPFENENGKPRLKTQRNYPHIFFVGGFARGWFFLVSMSKFVFIILFWEMYSNSTTRAAALLVFLAQAHELARASSL